MKNDARVFCLCFICQNTADGCVQYGHIYVHCELALCALTHIHQLLLIVEFFSTSFQLNMENLSENLESDEFVDKLLIECVKQRPSLYNTDIYSAADECQWDELQKLFGIQSKYVNHLDLFQ